LNLLLEKLYEPHSQQRQINPHDPAQRRHYLPQRAYQRRDHFGTKYEASSPEDSNEPDGAIIYGITTKRQTDD